VHLLSLYIYVCVNCFKSEYYKLHKTIQFGLVRGGGRLKGGGGNKSSAMEKGKELLLFFREADFTIV